MTLLSRPMIGQSSLQPRPSSVARQRHGCSTEERRKREQETRRAENGVDTPHYWRNQNKLICLKKSAGSGETCLKSDAWHKEAVEKSVGMSRAREWERSSRCS